MSAKHPVRYTLTARLLHWLIATAIMTSVVIAIISDGLPLTPHKIHLINYHKWSGLTVLWLLIVQIVWRLAHPPPDFPVTLAAWERNTALATHWIMYLLIAATPVLGWWLSSTSGFPLKYLGLILLPDLAEKNQTIAELIAPIHSATAWILIGLVALHVTAALKHHWLDHDDVLRRMI